ncbi:hypothetical protein GCM10009557_09760 [Virgisporangium ochraceum]
MSSFDSALIAVNSLTAAGLIVAGTTKLVVPQPVRRALRELLPGHEVPAAAVKIFAAAELMVAITLLLPASSVAAGYGLAVLGLTFAVAGLAGRARRSTVAFGYLGGGDQALGLRNVLAGVAFLGVAGLNVAAVSSDPDPLNAAPLAGAASTLLLCAWTYRALMWGLLGPKPAQADR